jgi:hypothetical protein
MLNTTMFDLEAHTKWILNAIYSCNTIEQMESAKVLISLLVIQMAKEKFDLKTIRIAEDDLISKWVDKYSAMMVQ